MGLFKYYMHNNPKLAEQLMFGSSDQKVSEINKRLWKKFNGSRSSYYLEIVKICGIPISPRARYVIAMAYAWNLTAYSKQAIKYIELYLSMPLYKKCCVNNGIYSAKQRTDLHKSEMYCYLGKSYRSIKNYDKSIESFKKAIDYTPYYIAPYLRLAETYSWKGELQSAINLLETAKTSKYAKEYTGNENLKEFFLNKDILNKKINAYKEKLFIQKTYPYNQKQIREIVTATLAKNGVNINFTQPKFKDICDYFNLKNNNKYFYRYPNSKIYRCSENLIQLLIDSLLTNQELIEFFNL